MRAARSPGPRGGGTLPNSSWLAELLSALARREVLLRRVAGGFRDRRRIHRRCRSSPAFFRPVGAVRDTGRAPESPACTPDRSCQGLQRVPSGGARSHAAVSSRRIDALCASKTGATMMPPDPQAHPAPRVGRHCGPVQDQVPGSSGRPRRLATPLDHVLRPGSGRAIWRHPVPRTEETPRASF